MAASERPVDGKAFKHARPRGKLTGVQLAGDWTPKAASEPGYEITMWPDIPIPLPDGTTLRGDLYRPKGQQAFPLLLAWGG